MNSRPGRPRKPVGRHAKQPFRYKTTVPGFDKNFYEHCYIKTTVLYTRIVIEGGLFSRVEIFVRRNLIKNQNSQILLAQSGFSFSFSFRTRVSDSLKKWKAKLLKARIDVI